MTPSSSDEILIARLFNLPAAERAARWQRACADDLGLAARLPEFARRFAEGAGAGDGESALAPSLSTGAIVDLLESALHARDHEAPGTRIGNYKLLLKIGEGGFGAVWMAEQLEPIRRRVALKIVKVGMDTEEVIARFEAERQALALMDHPNIARVFDAGATAAGRPFFAMELVRGVTITRYCDDNRLTAEMRLRLFMSVCQAVQHAHQKGIIHRDLKPSNILVTLHDGVPVPKVIDFGIAKATDKQLTEKTLVTHLHAFMGTPAYTSPEQMEMSGLDVDTRSDIYSLGVLLYELLAGRPPFDPGALLQSGLEEMRRTIREVDPPRPSHRLGTLSAPDRVSIAQARGTDLSRLALLLRGDVDWIVMRCLEKDRTRRYESASALARDVERHLASEPVVARPPSLAYRLHKLYHRRKLAVTATAAVALSLVGGLIASSTLLVREHAARSRAVTAEKSADNLRQQAEAARLAEAQRASRTSLALAEQMLHDGRTSEGLAHLVRAARSDPGNVAVGPRLISALAFRSFAEPMGETLRQPTPIWRAFYAPDSRHVLTFDVEGMMRYWDLASGGLRRTIAAGPVFTGDLSPDGRRCATGGADGVASIWDLESGRRVVGPLRHEQKITAIQFSPDGTRLATGGDDRITRIWNATTGELETTLRHQNPVRAIAFASGGDRLVTVTGPGPSRVWHLPDGIPVAPEIPSNTSDLGRGGSTTIGGFSPDGGLVVICDQRGAVLYDAVSGASVGARMFHAGPVYSAIFNRDGTQLVTASDDGNARLWEVPTGKPLLPPLLHGGRVTSPHLTPDERYLIAASFDGVARIWDLATGQLAMEPIRVGDVREVDLSPNGTEFITGGRDGVVRRWRLVPEAARPLVMPADAARLSLRRDPAQPGTVWAFYRDHAQRVDLLSSNPIGAPLPLPTAIVGASSLAPDGRHFTIRSESGEVEMWELLGGNIHRRPFHGGERPLVTFSGGEATSVFGVDSLFWVHLNTISGVLTVWRTDTGALALGPIENVNKAFSLSPDNRRLVAAMSDGSAMVWDVETRERRGQPLRHHSSVYGVRFSPDSRRIATTSQDGTAQVWDAETQTPVGPPMLHRNIVRGVAFARDGRRLLTWTPVETRVWDAATSEPLTEPMVGGNDVGTAVFSDDGTRVATWSRTGSDIRLWGSASGQMLAEPIRVTEALPVGQGLEFLASDRFLSLPSQRGMAIWPVPPQSGRHPVPEWLLRLAGAVAGGEIDERALFRERPADEKTFAGLRQELAALPPSGLYVEWGRWILADRGTRPIAPGLALKSADASRASSIRAPAQAPADDP